MKDRLEQLKAVSNVQEMCFLSTPFIVHTLKNYIFIFENV